MTASSCASKGCCASAPESTPIASAGKEEKHAQFSSALPTTSNFFREPQEQEQHVTPLWCCKVLYFLQLGCAASLVRFLVVLYTDLGIAPTYIGYLMCLDPLMCFVGQIFWAYICDATRVHKIVLSVSSALSVVFYIGLNLYQETLAAVFLFVGLAAFCRAGAQGIQDSLCLHVLKMHKDGGDSYGGQRMWGALGWGSMAFLTGLMVDRYGTNYMFVSYSVGTAISIALLLFYFPGAPSDLQMSPSLTPAEARRKKLFRFRAVWFFLNLIVYGSCMAMVETFLFVYLEREFVPPADKTLLGLSVAVMCVFELPVFFYFERVLEVLSERTVLNLCHVVFALRCLLYVLLPRGNVWTVLLVEPLHGITFAAMWTASVHYAQNHAPRGLETTMQAICNGLYQQLGFSIGSLLWGRVIDMYGFDVAYYTAGVVILSWGTIWALGWRIHESYSLQNVSLQRKLLASGGTTERPGGIVKTAVAGQV